MLLFEYFFPGFPKPIKYISFMMYFDIPLIENYKYTNYNQKNKFPKNLLWIFKFRKKNRVFRNLVSVPIY